MRHNPVKNAVLRWILIGIGWLSIAAGVIGIFLPLMPTVPLLLLAVYCFSRSSQRFHTWLIEHNRLGPLVKDYLSGGGMPLRAKLTAIGMIWVSFPISVFFFVQALWIRVLLLILAAGITLYLLCLPTRTSLDPSGEPKTKK